MCLTHFYLKGYYKNTYFTTYVLCFETSVDELYKNYSRSAQIYVLRKIHLVLFFIIFWFINYASLNRVRNYSICVWKRLSKLSHSSQNMVKPVSSKPINTNNMHFIQVVCTVQHRSSHYFLSCDSHSRMVILTQSLKYIHIQIFHQRMKRLIYYSVLLFISTHGLSFMKEKHHAYA